jgi:hypothetical protein
VDGLCSVMALTASYVLMVCKLVVGVDGRGQKSEATLAFLHSFISIMDLYDVMYIM